MRKALLIFCLFNFSYGATSLPTLEKPVFAPKVRSHSVGEITADLSTIYAVTWVFYILTQYYRIDQMSLDNMKSNVGHLSVWDGDHYYWNLVLHPFTGAELFMYYRSRAYSPFYSFVMTFASSSLFEFFIETATEKPSLNDIFITPVLGTLIGIYAERLSLDWINSNTAWKVFLGHIINPSTNFFWFEDRKFPQDEITAGLGFRIAF